MKIVGLCGYAGSGKTTVAGEFAGLCASEAIVVQQMSFATPVKDMIKVLLGCGDLHSGQYLTDPSLKEQPLDILNGRSVRYALQTLGTEWGRDMMSETLWTDLTMARLNKVGDVDVVIFDDVRFETETQAIRNRGGCVYEIDRRNMRYESTHSSEVVPSSDGTIRNMFRDEAAMSLFDCVFPHR